MACALVMLLHLLVIDALVEAAQLRQLHRQVQSHVVLHGVQTPQHQVEDADSIPQWVGKLLDDDGKTVQRVRTWGLGRATGGQPWAGACRAAVWGSDLPPRHVVQHPIAESEVWMGG